MSPSEKALDRYKNDPQFAVAVNYLAKIAQNGQLTAGELRDIAYVAALRVEALTTRIHFPITGERDK